MPVAAANSSISARNGGGEVLVTDLSATEAAASRDALCRAVYGRLFAWIVGRTNEAIKVPANELKILVVITSPKFPFLLCFR